MAKCSSGLYSGNETVHLAYDSDIEGIGQLTSFTLVAVTATILVTIHYLSSAEAPEVQTTLFTNPIDTRLRRYIAERRPRLKLTRDATVAIEKIALVLSDTQLVTGIAVLASAWSQFSDLRTYYWNIAWRLAWLASLTHLATLTTLRAYFRDRPILRTIRVVLMLVLLILIISAALPANCAGHSTVIRVSCAVSALRDGGCEAHGRFPSAILSLVVLLASFLVRFVKMTSYGAAWTARKSRIPISRWSKSFFQKLSSHPKSRFLCYVFLPMHNTFQVIADVLQSSFLEILWVYLSLAWGLTELFQSIKSIGDSQRWYTVSKINGEWTTVPQSSGTFPRDPKPSIASGWGFGQIVALVLLLLPILTIVESFYGDKTENKDPIIKREPSTTSVDPLDRHRLIQYTTPMALDSLSSPIHSGQEHTKCPTSGKPDIDRLQDVYINRYYKLQVYIIVWYNIALSVIISTSSRYDWDNPRTQRQRDRADTQKFSLEQVVPRIFAFLIPICYAISSAGLWSAVRFDHDNSKRLKKRLLYVFALCWTIAFSLMPFLIVGSMLTLATVKPELDADVG